MTHFEYKINPFGESCFEKFVKTTIGQTKVNLFLAGLRYVPIWVTITVRWDGETKTDVQARSLLHTFAIKCLLTAIVYYIHILKQEITKIELIFPGKQ